MRCEEVRRYIEKDMNKEPPVTYDYTVILKGCASIQVDNQPLSELDDIVKRCIAENKIQRDVLFFSVIDESVNWVIITEY